MRPREALPAATAVGAIRRWSASAVLAGGLLWSVTGMAELAFPGTTEPYQTVILSLPVAGRIDGIAVREGDRVNKGKVILFLDKSLEELELERRALALADHSALDAARRREELLRGQMDEIRRASAATPATRKQKEEVELALLAVVADRQALEVAERREKLDHEAAREALDRRSLRSPIDGVVTRLHRRVGESVNALDPLVRLVDVTRGRFIGLVTATVGARLRVGRTVTVRIAGSAEPVVRSALVVYVSPVLEQGNLVEVKAEFDNLDGAVRPGGAGEIVVDDEGR